MKKFFCDACGDEIEKFKKINVNFENDGGIIAHYDLCEKCLKVMRDAVSAAAEGRANRCRGPLFGRE